MSNVFTLDSLREEVDKEFAPLKIRLSDGTEAVLKGLLRMNDKKRDQVLDLIKSINSSDDESEADLDGIKEMSVLAAQLFELISDQGGKLVEDLDGDLQLMLKVISTWMGSTQLGEASNSPA